MLEIFQVSVLWGDRPRVNLYLGKPCSTSRLLSQGDGRGTRQGSLPAGSPVGHPDRCTGYRAGVRRSGRLGATPPRGCKSSLHARRLKVGGLGLGHRPESSNGWGWGLGEPLLHHSGPATLPTKWRPEPEAGPHPCHLSHFSSQS